MLLPVKRHRVPRHRPDCSLTARGGAGLQVMNAVLAVAGAGWYIFSRVLLARLTTRANTAQVRPRAGRPPGPTARVPERCR